MQLLISSSWWFILLCFAAGGVYAYILYQPKWNLWWSKILATIRFLTVSFLCFCLLSPLIIQNKRHLQKPVILMVMDNSQSIGAGKDSNFYKNQLKDEWQKTSAAFGNEYEVQFLTLGSKINVSDSVFFNEKRTNLGQLFDYVNNTYTKQNVGAVVLASDGIYNKGNNPLYKQLDNHVALFTIGMGDSLAKKDAVIKELNVNSIAYMGNEFPININLSAYACQNNNPILTITIDGNTILSQPVNINQTDYFKNINLMALADKPGTKHIIVTLSVINGEVSKINNRKDAFIEIIDGREKILLTYNGPHPDIGALKSAISANSNYEIISLPAREVKISELSKFSVVILHQLPSKSNNAKDIISNCRQLKIPVWGITGNQSAIELLPTLTPLSKISNNQGRLNESQAVFNNNFNTFTLEDNTKAALANFPPVIVPYGNYAATDNAEVMAYQKIGAVTTRLPLWAFMNDNEQKTAMLFGEGFWRWRIADFAENENHLATNELVSKTIQFLATKDDKRKFRVYPTKQVYEEDETIKFIAELYNNSYELVNQVDVKIELTDREAKLYKYTFSPNNKSYQLTIGTMPPGIYKFRASADGIKDIVTGQILVVPLQTELVNTTADFGLLRQMAANNHGSFAMASELQNTINAIKKNTAISSASYMEKQIEELINMKWLFFIILFLLSLEWFVRKYEGGY